jgi:hypothetical protein
VQVLVVFLIAWVGFRERDLVARVDLDERGFENGVDVDQAPVGSEQARISIRA